MTPAELREARQALGLTLAQMARLLGYAETKQAGHALESGDRAIRPAQARLMRAYIDGYRPKDWPHGTTS